MFRRRAAVVGQKKVAPGHFILTLRVPEIARRAEPGQFVQILCSDSMDPLLPRPFSFLSTNRRDLALLYHVVGKGTQALSQLKKGETLSVLGPLGRGFSQKAALGKTVFLVGGGVGIPPLFHLAQTLKNKKNVRVFLGARNKSFLLCEKDFKKLGVLVENATDDGSKGHKGYVTEILEKALKTADASKTQMYTCGPTPMLKAVSRLSKKYGIPCEVSVEVPMACGFGACLGCAIEVTDPREKPSKTRYAIACQEGPVFPADLIVWN